MQNLIDSQGRIFHYLRLSLTEVCNFRCQYCLPHGFQKSPGHESELSVDEIRRLVSAFANLGFWKIRLTGGEPTNRRDLLDVVQAIAAIPGIRRIGITTNGTRLSALAPAFFAAGIQAINVSVDSLDQSRFSEITGTDRFSEVISGVDSAIACGFESVKVNTVLLKGMNSDEIEHFIEWVRDRPISVRFIEVMRTGDNGDFFGDRHLSAGIVQLQLARLGWKMLPKESGDGPALEYGHPDYRGRIGVIAPYSKDFCLSCNRLRVSSRGGLRLCLFGEKDLSLRPLLQADHQRDELVTKIRSLIEQKPASHFLHKGIYGNTRHLASIGG